MTVTPISGALGAEVAGLDLARFTDPVGVAQIRLALAEHGVLFFRDQSLTPDRQIAFASLFGPLFVHPHIAGIPGYPSLLSIKKEPHETVNFGGGGWHSDVTYLDPPAMGSLLYALEVPAHGGDTLFANQYLAYESLSSGLRTQLDRLSAVHSYEGPGRAADHYVEHRVVRRHPETGRKALYVNGMFTTRFSGMTEAESRPLLDYLIAQAVRPEFTCRFQWRKGSLAFWDNRCVQHYPVNDYHGQRRVMHRVSVMECPGDDETIRKVDSPKKLM